jgi:tetratricopeptide (TPR) repeat protein
VTVSLDDVAVTDQRRLIIDTLLEERLLTADQPVGSSVPHIRLVHEALIQNWPRLTGIVETDREFLEARTRIRVEAAKWDAEGRSDDSLITSPRRLGEGREIIESRRDELDPLTITYIEGSLMADAARQRVARERERAEERRQLEAAQALAAERARTVRRTRAGLVAAIILAVVASVIGYYSLEKKREAVARQKGEVEAKKIAEENLKLSENALAGTRQLLDEVTRTIGSNRHFSRIGAEDLQAELLNILAPHYESLAAMSKTSAGFDLARGEALLLLGRLTERTRSNQEATPVFKGLYQSLLTYAGHSQPTEDEKTFFLKTVALYGANLSILSRSEEAKFIFAKASEFTPSEDANLRFLPNSYLDSVATYLFKYSELVPWTEETQWRAEIHKKQVELSDILSNRDPDNPEYVHSRWAAYANWADTLRQQGKYDEAAAASEIAFASAEKLYTARPSSLISLTAYVWELSDRANRMVEGGDLVGAEAEAQKALRLAEGALAFSPDSISVLERASQASDVLGNIYTYRKDNKTGMEYHLKSIQFISRRLEKDPENSSVAANAITRLSNLTWTLTEVGDHEKARQACLRLAERAVNLGLVYYHITEHHRFAVHAIQCALDAEKALGEKADEQTVEQFVVNNAKYVSTLVSEHQIEPHQDKDYYEKLLSLIQKLQSVAQHNGNVAVAESYARDIIQTTNRLRPEFDYDIYLMGKLSKAFRDSAEQNLQDRDFTKAAENFRICADPERVPYPNKTCMEKLAELIENGALGTGHEEEAKKLRERAPHYALKQFTIPISINPGAPKASLAVYVTTPPKGYEGIDNQVKWFKDHRGIHVQEDIIESFRKLHRIANEHKVSFPELAAYALGSANEAKNPISPRLSEADELISKGDVLEAGHVLVAADKQIDDLKITDDEKTKLHTAVADKLGKAGQKLDALGKPAEALEVLTNAQALFSALVSARPSSELNLAIATNLDRLMSVSAQVNKLDEALRYTREAIAIREQVLRDDPKNAGCECEIARNYETIGIILDAQNDPDGARAAHETALTIRRKMAKAEPTQKRWQHFLAKNLVRTSRLQATKGHPDAFTNAKEAVLIWRSFAMADKQSVQYADELIEALKNAASISNNARVYVESMSLKQEEIILIRRLIERGEDRKDQLVSSLGNLSWYGLCAGDPQIALAAASEALELDPSQTWIETNFAHAKMFLGDTKAAMALYRRNKGKEFSQGVWDDVIRADFTLLKETGHSHPLMQDVLSALENGTKARTNSEEGADK